jgi:hypothetical protein
VNNKKAPNLYGIGNLVVINNNYKKNLKKGMKTLFLAAINPQKNRSLESADNTP